MVKRPILIVDNPVDIPVPLFGAVAIFVLYNMSRVYAGSTEFSSVSSDAITQMTIGIGGLGGLLLAVLFLRSPKGRNISWIGSTFGKDNFYQIWNLIGATFTYFGAEVVGIFLEGELFQVVSIDVYAFYLSGSIAEELLYRGAIVVTAQALIWWMIYGLSKKSANSMTEKSGSTWIMNVVCILLSGGVFAAVHVPYWGNASKMLLTFIGGCGQAFWYIRSKSLIVAFVPHAIVNALGAGSLLQSLTPNPATVEMLPDICSCIQNSAMPVGLIQIAIVGIIAAGIALCWYFSRGASRRNQVLWVTGAVALLVILAGCFSIWGWIPEPYPNSWTGGG